MKDQCPAQAAQPSGRCGTAFPILAVSALQRFGFKARYSSKRGQPEEHRDKKQGSTNQELP